MGEPLVAISTSEGARRPGGDGPDEASRWSGSFRRLCYCRGASIASRFLALCVLLGPAAAATAQVDAARLERADQDRANWLIYGRTYSDQRFSPLARITADNANQLGLAWYADFDINRGQEATPLVIRWRDVRFDGMERGQGVRRQNRPAALVL
jgi:glucose dehydrogenase